jgi:regulator of sirC expression with transglutaminase-like and TPR domain
VLDLIYDFGQVRRIDFVDLLLAYLECVQKHLDPHTGAGQLLRVYDLILSLKTADPKTLLRRACLHKQLGQISDSLADLKRYLNFQAPQPLAQSLKRIYTQLSHP